MGSSCSVLWGRQISAIVNNCVNTVVSETPHELANQFVRPNLLTYGVDLTFEVEFQQKPLIPEAVLLNQGRKVANLSDRGYELRSDMCDMVTSQLSREPANLYNCIPNSCSAIWGSGAMVELCVCDCDASRLKWFPLESERFSIKPMGSGCAMISNIVVGVLGLVVIQGQPSVCGQWTTCSQLSRTSNFSESGNGVNVGTESNWSTELAVSISPGGPEPSLPMSNCPTGSTAQPYACGDASGKDNLPASSLICPDPVELPLRWIVRSVGPRALIAPGDEGLKAGRIPLECKLYSTQSESQPAAPSSLNS